MKSQFRSPIFVVIQESFADLLEENLGHIVRISSDGKSTKILVRYERPGIRFSVVNKAGAPVQNKSSRDGAVVVIHGHVIYDVRNCMVGRGSLKVKITRDPSGAYAVTLLVPMKQHYHLERDALPALSVARADVDSITEKRMIAARDAGFEQGLAHAEKHGWKRPATVNGRKDRRTKTPTPAEADGNVTSASDDGRSDSSPPQFATGDNSVHKTNGHEAAHAATS